MIRVSTAFAALLISSKAVLALDVGDWKISYFPATGAPSGCMMSGSYTSGTRLSLAVSTEYKWGIVLSNDSWVHQKGEGADIAAFVDGSFIASGRSTVLDVKTVYLPFSGQKAYKALQDGHKLEIKTPKATMSFALPNTMKAMDATLDCVKSALNKSGGGTAEAPPKRQSVDFSMIPQAEALALLTNLLNSAGMTGYKVSASDPSGSAAEYVTADGAKGFLVAARGNTRTADDYAGYVTGRMSELCKGQFLSGKEAVASTDGSVVRKLITTCRSGAKEEAMQTTIIRRPDGFLMQLTEAVVATQMPDQQQRTDKDRSALVNAAMTWTERK